MFSTSVRNLGLGPDEEDAAFDKFIKDLLIDPSTVSQDTLNAIKAMYPANDTSLGGAFNTGDSLFDRVEVWYTDNMYLSARRLLFNGAASLQPLFAYFFTEPIPGQDPTLGGMTTSSVWLVELRSHTHAPLVFHGSELALLFGLFPAVELEFASQMADFYVNFIHDMDPGGGSPAPCPV